MAKAKVVSTIRVNVTAKDIAAGVAGNCFRCPVALALARATRDTNANVYESNCITLIEVWGRHIVAPDEVRHFVWSFDDAPRLPDKRIVLIESDDMPKPFTFELPNQDSPEWQERCYGCEELFASAELDDEGNCKQCKED